MASDKSLNAWIARAKAGEIKRFQRENDIDYITTVPIENAQNLFGESDTEQGSSDFCLAAFVPERDIMSDVMKILWTSAAIAIAAQKGWLG